MVDQPLTFLDSSLSQPSFQRLQGVPSFSWLENLPMDLDLAPGPSDTIQLHTRQLTSPHLR